MSTGADDPPWLGWAREVLAIAQAGQAYARDPHDAARYGALRALGQRMVADQAGNTPAAIAHLLRHEAGYPTPKVELRGAVFRPDGALLMVRERADGDRWTLPGGWADAGLPPATAMAREIREESGYAVAVERLVAVWDRRTQGYPVGLFPCYTLFFLCRPTGGAPRTGVETSGTGWFTRDRLPADLSPGRIRPHQLRRMFDHHDRPDLPADFD